MEKRQIFIGICIGVISIVLFAIYLSSQERDVQQEVLTKIEEAEISIEKNGVKNIAGFYPKYEKIEIEYYYKDDYCFNILKTTTQRFNELVSLSDIKKLKKIDKSLLEKLNSQENNISIPIAILSGNADVYDYGNNYIKSDGSFKTLINGISACSEKILTYELCSILKAPPQLCNKISIKENNIEAEKSISSDLCYDYCNINFFSNDKFFIQTWQGPPCNKIDGYVEGESKIKSKECYKSSCKSDENDKGCCKSTECVYESKCYFLLTTKDIDNDGQKELCGNINDASIWINPDSDSKICSDAGFSWFNCLNKAECKYGINNYNNNSAGLCCGDDKGEYVNQCKGKICNNENDIVCCKANSCVFNGKCYENGCNQIKIDTREGINVFCNGETNSWVDLDDGYCVQCLGKKAWSATICCGDDAKEGKYPIRFVVNDKNNTNEVLYYGCAHKETDCVYPYSEILFSEGIYVFKEDTQYLQGTYYCDDSQWYSLDNNEKYCTEIGYNWDENREICCGENANEYYLKGSDGTSACCRLPNDNVFGGECYPTKLCGNDILNSGESCELPNNENNTYCQQSQQQCLGNKFGIRDTKGYCNGNCLCEEDEFTYSCVKNNCGAECGNDNDCSEDKKSDLNSCSCKPKAYCGDNTVQSYNDFGQKEECEPPNTIDNTYCKIEECKNKKSISAGIGVNYNYGECKNNCQCDYGSVNYGCRKNLCGAECNEDGSGCSKGMLCNTETCNCYSLFICGNGICEEGEENSCPSDCKVGECPYRIDLKLDKKNYYLNDVVSVEIIIYDKNKNTLPETKFDLDVLVNDIFVGSSTYTTTSVGSYITKKNVNKFPRGLHKYVVRATSKIQKCQIVSDTDLTYIYVDNPYIVSPAEINYSKFEFIIDKFNVTSEKIKSKCGDGIIGYGEACEGSSICRPSFECDYKNKIYDLDDHCTSCSCPEDKKSEPSDEVYCSNCQSCGDGIVNCNEECENGTRTLDIICRYGKLYNRVDTCLNCKWNDDGLNSDILVDNCECKCPKNPENNCINGNYINYTQDYNAGCSNGECNFCNCVDIYTKDSNIDGIEDKCSPELCGNKIDDNDNSLVDEQGCIWYYCSQCGYGLFNFCTRQECSKFKEGCFFNKNCNACSSISACEEYELDNKTCINDTCSIGSCIWDGNKCCTDKDNDRVCDLIDNCLDAYNPNQENSDKDFKGDICELCINEPLLFEPSEQKESSCEDGIDNDCDGLDDCKDSDCAGIANCCQNVNDCKQDYCTIERCINNRCDYEIRNFCDNAECPKGSYCDINGECKEPDSSSNVCLNCIFDATSNDYGIGYVNLFNQFFNITKNICCGDQSNEFYILQKETLQSACCNSSASCIDYLGKCYNSNTPYYDEHNWHCSINLWYECSDTKNVLCAEAGSTYVYNEKYKANNETRWFCTFNSARFGWRSAYPKEVCYDKFDNDCDEKIDFNDEDCQK